MTLGSRLSGLLGLTPHGRDQKRVRKEDLQWRPLEWAGTVKIIPNTPLPKIGSQEPVAEGTWMLVTNRDQTIQYVAEMEPWARDLIGVRPCVYAYAELRAGVVNVQYRVPDEGW